MPSNLGQNWILLRGLSRESAHWGSFVNLMESTFPDASLTLLDLPGTGYLHKAASPTAIIDFVEQVRCSALEQNCLNQPATILALSLGAMVAWEWLLSYPDEICGAALIGTSFAGLSPWYQRLRWQSYGRLLGLIRQKTMEDRELAILQLVSNRRDQDGQIKEQWEKIQTERPVNIKNTYRQILAAAAYKPDDRKPKQPVLLMHGRGDKLVAPECSAAIQKKWNLPLEMHPWGGHDLPLDDDLWVISRLKKWIDIRLEASLFFFDIKNLHL
ncbi:MAG: alpha/beta hydrolase [Methylococcaceae bacterium]|nr:alpha/beta hydrolase [Methylococcaceae bacterium]